jgi:imidazolonepropionase-like amidohydrolase
MILLKRHVGQVVNLRRIANPPAAAIQCNNNAMRIRLFARILIALAITGNVNAQPAIAFTNVAVVDVQRGVLRPDQTVVIEGNRIAALDDAGRVHLPRGARVIGGHGKFLMPGLWDMHVHEMPSPHVAELFVANGVTGIRDMYDDQPKIRELRQAIQEHRRTGPRVVASGRILNGVVETHFEIVISTPEQGRQAVRQQIKDGVDFVKVYNALPREAYYAIADECKRNRIPFVGHTPDSVTTAEAAAAGQRSIEHLDGVLLDCSGNTAWLRWSRVFIPDKRMLDSFDPARANRLFAAFVRYGTWQCPTLSYYQSVVFADDLSLVDNRQDPNLARYLPNFWLPHPGKNTLNLASDRAVQRKMMEVTAMMFRAGVGLLAGTDTGALFVLPGFGLHDELELMAAAGLPVSAVLRIATLAPAQFFGWESELGTVTRGKLADLILLDADPLKSIRNTRLVRAVVADGRLYDRAALDGLLRDAGTAAAHLKAPSRGRLEADRSQAEPATWRTNRAAGRRFRCLPEPSRTRWYQTRGSGTDRR